MKTVLPDLARNDLAQEVHRMVMSQKVVDVHTHLYDPALTGLLLWGIDELLTYHYLVAEAFRYSVIPYQKFWALSKTEQADLIWGELFEKHSPVSEACRGVLTTLQLLGLEVKKRDLPALRRWFAGQKLADQVSRCLELAGIQKVYMTNSPFDDLERPAWENGFTRDERFEAGLRIDPVLLSWPQAAPRLARWGYDVRASSAPQKTFDEVKRFLADWTDRLRARYIMVSLPADFEYPARNITTQLLDRAVLPICREKGLPLAMMPGVKRAVNPELQLAGDGVGLTDLTAVQNLCAGFPQNKFLATVLARENQHELCVLARKFHNLHIFGCWWFLNVPHLIAELTRLRLELLGLSFTPQHSDARVLEQVVYKWRHSRQVIAPILAEKYTALAETGWIVDREDLERDVAGLFGGNFEQFLRS